MLPKVLVYLTPIPFIFLLPMEGCQSNNNPISSRGFPVEAGSILFISDTSGTKQLYSMNEDGSNVQQLTNDSNFPISDAKWSPDGKKIAVVLPVSDKTVDPFFRNAIFIMDADGKNSYQLTKPYFSVVDAKSGNAEYGGALHPVWSPNSRQIAFTRLQVPEASGNEDIFLINVDGTNEKRVTGTVSYSEECCDWKSNTILIDKVDWSARDSSGKGINHVTIDIIDTLGNTMHSFGKLGESWGTPKWGENTGKIFFSLGKTIQILDTVSLNVTEIISDTITYSGYSVVTVERGGILLKASYGIYFNRILLCAENGVDIHDITPFDANNLFATSWRR